MSIYAEIRSLFSQLNKFTIALNTGYQLVVVLSEKFFQTIFTLKELT